MATFSSKAQNDNNACLRIYQPEYPLAEDKLRVDVRQHKDEVIPGRGVASFRVKRVISPFEFYLEYILTDPTFVSYNDWFKAMQRHYASPKVVAECQLKTEILPGQCYVCMDNNEWHRVRVHGVNGFNNSALAFFLDLGMVKHVYFEDFLMLSPKFSTWPAQVYRAFLYDIMPSNRNGLNWSIEACLFFKDFVQDKEYSGMVLCRSEDKVSRGFSDVYYNIGVVLFAKPLLVGVDFGCPVNSIMVKKGYANSTGIFGTCRHQIELPGYTPYFNKEDFTQKFNSHLPTKDRQTNSAVVLTKEFYASVISNAMKAVSSMASSQLSLDRWEYNVKEKSTYYASVYPIEMGEVLPKNFSSQLCPVNLGFVKGPSHIIVHLQTNLQNLREMEACLGKLFQTLNGLEFEELSPGIFLACRITAKTNGESICYRGVVISIFPKSKSASILLVDYGSEIKFTANQSQFRSLPEYFQKIPSFAVRVHLDTQGIQPMRHHANGWSHDASISFRKFIFSLKYSKPKYYMYLHKQRKRLELESYSQEIGFVKQQWVTMNKKKTYTSIEDQYKVINTMKDHPMLKSLFCSVGVELVYKVTVAPQPFQWEVEQVYWELIDRGHAIAGKELKFKNKDIYLEFS